MTEVKKLIQAIFIHSMEDFEWVSSIVVTPKKNGKWRICVDFKTLNVATKRDPFPLPFQHEILNEVVSMNATRCVMDTLANSKST